jgi:GST-like protein
MAAYPWTVSHERQQQNLDDFPNLKRWFHAIKERPATIRAYEKAKEINPRPWVMSEEDKKVLFGGLTSPSLGLSCGPWRSFPRLTRWPLKT